MLALDMCTPCYHFWSFLMCLDRLSCLFICSSIYIICSNLSVNSVLFVTSTLAMYPGSIYGHINLFFFCSLSLSISISLSVSFHFIFVIGVDLFSDETCPTKKEFRQMRHSPELLSMSSCKQYLFNVHHAPSVDHTNPSGCDGISFWVCPI